MKKKWFVGAFTVFALLFTCAWGLAESEVTSSPLPLPPALSSLPVIAASPWVQVDPSPETFLEGPAFDRDGNLYFVALNAGKIFKVGPDKKISTVYSQPGLAPCGLAIHKDGRLFVVCISGQILSMNPDGSNATEIRTRYWGKPVRPNDCVFDSKGNLYVTDWTGTLFDPTGGVYRFSADFKTVQPVVQNMAGPNGILLSPEGNVLWVGEMLRNGLIRIELLPDGVSLPPITPVTCVYYFSGLPGPDGSAIDSKGQVYQAINFQGRVVVLRAGVPIAQVVIPGRDEGKHILVTNAAFKPGTSEVYLTLAGKDGGWIYTFPGLAEGLKLFSHQ